jgi:hypothetical protein
MKQHSILCVLPLRLCAFAGDAFMLLIHLPLKLRHYPFILSIDIVKQWA